MYVIIIFTDSYGKYIMHVKYSHKMCSSKQQCHISKLNIRQVCINTRKQKYGIYILLDKYESNKWAEIYKHDSFKTEKFNTNEYQGGLRRLTEYHLILKTREK